MEEDLDDECADDDDENDEGDCWEAGPIIDLKRLYAEIKFYRDSILILLFMMVSLTVADNWRNDYPDEPASGVSGTLLRIACTTVTVTYCHCHMLPWYSLIFFCGISALKMSAFSDGCQDEDMMGDGSDSDAGDYDEHLLWGQHRHDDNSDDDDDD